MIIDVKKYLLFGTTEDLSDFFERAQHQGYIEFIHPSGKRPLELTPDIQALVSALKILRKLPPKAPYEGGGPSIFAVETAQRVISLKNEIERLAEETRILEAEIVRVAPFGDFSIDEIDFIEREGKRKIRFFCMKSAKSHKTSFSSDVIYIDTVYDLDYFIIINKEQTHYPDMIEMRIDRSAPELQTHLTFVKESLRLLEAELKGLAGHSEFLHKILIEKLNDYHLAAAKKEVHHLLGGQTLFSIEAWIPANKVLPVFGMLDGMAIHAEEIEVEEKDRKPTYMENKGIPRLGEDLVHVYDTPANTDKDPSGWVFWSFMLFFAIIIADGGYGFIFLALSLFGLYKFPKLKGTGKRLLKLGVALSISCIIWGVATSAYFGLEFSPDSTSAKYSLIGYLAKKKMAYHISHEDDVYTHFIKEFPQLAPVKDPQEFLEKAVGKKGDKIAYVAYDEFRDNILLEFSLLIGVIHISLSLLRYLKRHIANLGWITFLIGGYLFFPSILHCTSLLNFLGIIDKQTATAVGLELIYAGIGGAVLLAFIQKKWKGFSEIASVVQVFADVLSYIRLYALALASSILAFTFNDLGSGAGMIMGALVILFGHAVTITLAIMAGVIHGLRLNFIEWYHYSFEGGGRLFNPLRKMKP